MANLTVKNFAHHEFATEFLRRSARRMLIVLAVLAVVAAALASAQTFQFNRADFPTGTDPKTLAVGDFNGDGIMDVVTGNDSTADTVSVLLGEGNGTFASHVDYAVGGAVASVAVGDFNGD